MAQAEVAFVAKDVLDRFRSLSPQKLLDLSIYHGAYEQFEAARLPDDVRVVVFIDDLDRCFPHHAVRLLESIKLVLAQPGFIFVLAVDRAVIPGPAVRAGDRR